MTRTMDLGEVFTQRRFEKFEEASSDEEEKEEKKKF
jgi:hypothetical protein